jgi:hypothetical protein
VFCRKSHGLTRRQAGPTQIHLPHAHAREKEDGEKEWASGRSCRPHAVIERPQTLAPPPLSSFALRHRTATRGASGGHEESKDGGGAAVFPWRGQSVAWQVQPSRPFAKARWCQRLHGQRWQVFTDPTLSCSDLVATRPGCTCVRGLALGIRWRRPMVDGTCGGGCGKRGSSWPRQARDGVGGDGRDVCWTAWAAADAAGAGCCSERGWRGLVCAAVAVAGAGLRRQRQLWSVRVGIDDSFNWCGAVMVATTGTGGASGARQASNGGGAGLGGVPLLFSLTALQGRRCR